MGKKLNAYRNELGIEKANPTARSSVVAAVGKCVRTAAKCGAPAQAGWRWVDRDNIVGPMLFTYMQPVYKGEGWITCTQNEMGIG